MCFSVVAGEVMSVLRDATNADDLAKRKEEARRKRRKKKTATSLVSSCFQGKLIFFYFIFLKE